MSLERRTTKRAFFQAVAALFLAQFLLAMAMAASPDLHRHIHHDADDDGHECVATHLINGNFSDGVPAQMVAVRPLIAPDHFHTIGDFPVAWVPPLFLAGCILERAPPGLG